MISSRSKVRGRGENKAKVSKIEKVNERETKKKLNSSL